MIMAALTKNKNMQPIEPTSNTRTPHNKSIEKQRRLFPTKQKAKKAKKVFKKPTATEGDLIAVQLII